MNVRAVNLALTLASAAGVVATSAAVAERLPTRLAIHWNESGPEAVVNGTASLVSVTAWVVVVIVMAGLVGHFVQLISPVVVGTAAAVTVAAAIYGSNEGVVTAAAARPPGLEDVQGWVPFVALLGVVAAVVMDAQRRRRARLAADVT